ncbi:MAG: ATP-dependent DNA helicase [Elusimicrobia bacterium]|nr:ATP-dependent DNA helicase [Elusimicrobiota bacterium]
MDIQSLFADDGPLSRVDPRFEARPQQAQMAAAVAEALERETNLVVEAGTGVGKSLAYLLPGALWAVSRGRRLLVSTHTRALQEQLLEKDLPMAARVLRLLGHSLRYAMLQGADNYLCAQRLGRAAESPAMLPEAVGRVVAELAAWARTAETGHRSALPCLVPQGLWSRLSRDPELCQGPGGCFWSGCLYRKDRERAERSHVLVVNHALLLSGARLPAYDALVIDEAHNLEETAVSRFGLSVSPARLANLLEDIRPFGFEALRAKSAEDFAAFFAALANAHGRSGDDAEPGGRLLSGLVDIAAPKSLAALEKGLDGAAAAAGQAEKQVELRLLQGRAAALRSDLAAILSGESEDLARWIEWSPRGIELRVAPLEVAQRLSEGLFSRGIPVVMTSATLSAGDGLKDFKSAVGCPDARELVLDSPFDYPTQAGLLIMDDLPEPSDDSKYASSLSARCRKIIDAVPGGLFILFSSWKSLRRVHAILRKTVKGRPLWVQGDSGHDALISDFTQAGNAVLLGVDTFWQGVDVSGGALSCVVLVKLPFANFGSPIEEARRAWFEANGKGYFHDFSLPRAVMKFRQGFGRLIRSSTDRGAVVVLDPRIVKKGYGRAFLEALPRCRRLATLAELGTFFAAENSN